MMNSHVFAHQTYGHGEPAWMQAHHNNAAQQAAAAAQHQYQNIRMTQNAGPAHNPAHAQEASMMEGVTEENRRVLVWISDLLNEDRRETALLELSKKREQVPELALILWHSFGEFDPDHYMLAVLTVRDLGVMTSLLQEIISVYTLLNPSQLTAAASNRVCNALALLQCVASHNETRALFLNGMCGRKPRHGLD
jgi:CCR4-NOT transcription complex subunit 9